MFYIKRKLITLGSRCPTIENIGANSSTSTRQICRPPRKTRFVIGRCCRSNGLHLPRYTFNLGVGKSGLTVIRLNESEPPFEPPSCWGADKTPMVISSIKRSKGAALTRTIALRVMGFMWELNANRTYGHERSSASLSPIGWKRGQRRLDDRVD